MSNHHLFPRFSLRDFVPVDGPKATAALESLTNSAPLLLTGLPIVEQQALPFYPGWNLIRIRSEADLDSPQRHGLIGPAGEATLLDGTSPPIHELNQTGALLLTEQTVTAYLGFFCFYVRGESGPFYLLEDPGDPMVPHEAWMHMSSDGAFLEEVIMPVALLCGTAEAGWYLCGTVYYGTALYAADFKVRTTGMIEMVDDELRLPGLPRAIQAVALV